MKEENLLMSKKIVQCPQRFILMVKSKGERANQWLRVKEKGPSIHVYQEIDVFWPTALYKTGLTI